MGKITEQMKSIARQDNNDWLKIVSLAYDANRIHAKMRETMERINSRPVHVKDPVDMGSKKLGFMDIQNGIEKMEEAAKENVEMCNYVLRNDDSVIADWMDEKIKAAARQEKPKGKTDA